MPKKNANKHNHAKPSNGKEYMTCNNFEQERRPCCYAAEVAFFIANEAPALLNAFKVPMCPVEAFLQTAANEVRSKVVIFSPHHGSFKIFLMSI